VPAVRRTEAADSEQQPTEARRRIDTAHVLVAVVVTAAALVGTLVVLGNAQPSTEPVESTALASSDLPAGHSPTPAGGWPTSSSEAAQPTVDATPATLVVHVVGDVARPGVVRVPDGSRVADALEAAGGAHADADLSTVNLARLVTDGEQVRVGLPPAPELSAPQASGPGAVRLPVDVNTASAAQLTELPGIGPVLGERIVAFRTENGPFGSLDQLLEVPGIGPATLQDIDGRVRL
jgi:competence protein ComEA